MASSLLVPPTDIHDVEKANTSSHPRDASMSVSCGTVTHDFVATPIGTCDVTLHRRSSEVGGPNWPVQKRAYVVLLGCWLLMFNSWGLVNAYGTFQSYYLQELLPGRDQYLLNLIGSTQSFVVLFLSFIVGRLLDAGHARLLVGCGTILVTLGMLLLSFVNGDGSYNSGNYALIWLVQGFITGLGMACFFVTSSQGQS